MLAQTSDLERLFWRKLLEEPPAGRPQRLKAALQVGGDGVFRASPRIAQKIR